MIEGPEHCYSAIGPDGAGRWQASLTEESLEWLGRADQAARTKATELMERTERDPADAAENAERACAVLAIACGLAPDPAHVPVVFLLGKTRSSMNYLAGLEESAREFLPDAHRPGLIARLQADRGRRPTNPVAQARAIHHMMQMPNGHWPPRTDVIDDCIDLNSRYAP